jgi:hypothetical protein
MKLREANVASGQRGRATALQMFLWRTRLGGWIVTFEFVEALFQFFQLEFAVEHGEP